MNAPDLHAQSLVDRAVADLPLMPAVDHDNGPSIPAEHLGRIFDPLYTTQQAGQGMGLGCVDPRHGRVKRHGGLPSADVAPGGGIRFVIERPAVPAPATDVPHLGGRPNDGPHH